MKNVTGARLISILDNPNCLNGQITKIVSGNFCINNIAKILVGGYTDDERSFESYHTRFYCYDATALSTLQSVFEKNDRSNPRLYNQCTGYFDVIRKRMYNYEIENSTLSIYPALPGGGRKPKLNQEQKRQVVEDYANGKTQAEICKMNGISISTFKRIIFEFEEEI